MVKCEGVHVQFKGHDAIIFAEVTMILRGFYQMMTEIHGEEQAKEILVDVGRYAVKSDEELNSEVEEGMKEWLDSM